MIMMPHLYSNAENQVLGARSEKIGCAVNLCLGMMEYWNVGPGEMQKKISRGRNDGLGSMISFFDTLGKSGINPPTADEFYTQYSIIPPFHHSIRRANTTPLGCNQSRVLPPGCKLDPDSLLNIRCLIT
jgi:hypothetical protein